MDERLDRLFAAVAAMNESLSAAHQSAEQAIAKAQDALTAARLSSTLSERTHETITAKLQGAHIVVTDDLLHRLCDALKPAERKIVLAYLRDGDAEESAA